MLYRAWRTCNKSCGPGRGPKRTTLIAPVQNCFLCLVLSVKRVQSGAANSQKMSAVAGNIKQGSFSTRISLRRQSARVRSTFTVSVSFRGRPLSVCVLLCFIRTDAKCCIGYRGVPQGSPHPFFAHPRRERVLVKIAISEPVRFA